MYVFRYAVISLHHVCAARTDKVLLGYWIVRFVCDSAVDLNGDGKISYEEFKAMMQGIRQGTSRYKALQGSNADSKENNSRGTTPRHSFDDGTVKAAPFTTSSGGSKIGRAACRERVCQNV